MRAMCKCCRGPCDADCFSSPQIFHGNSDNYSHKKNVFDVPFHARFVRILPVAWHNRITLRVELLGCDD